MRSCHRIFLLLIICGIELAMNALPSCASVGVYLRLAEEVGSAYKLRKAMKEIKASGIDFIIPPAKGNSGAVYFDSKTAPKELINDPAYIGKIIKFAHAEGLKVHPYFCVCTEGLDSCNALVKEHPSWAVHYQGSPRGWIDPGNPDARKYEIGLIKELVEQYDVDGISLDYMRGPNRIAYTESGRLEFQKRYKVDMAEIVAGKSEAVGTEGGDLGKEPSPETVRKNPIWSEWRKWWTRQNNQMMKDLEHEVHKMKPGLPISSYCWGAHTYAGNFETYQDWKTWIRNGWLAWINPSGYRYDDASFKTAAKLNRDNIPKGFPYYITIGVKTSHGSLKSAEEIEHQLLMARDAGADGVVFFTWEALKPFTADITAAIKKWK